MGNKDRQIATKDKKAIIVRELLMCLILGAIGVGVGLWITKVSRRPSLVVEKAVHDFGAVPAGADVNHVFLLRNAGRQALTVNKVSTSCGCIKEATMVGAKTILPGDSGNLRVTLESPVHVREVNESLELHTNDPVTPVKQLHLKATTIPSIELSPGVVDFGIVETSDLPITKNVRVSNYTQTLQPGTVRFTSSSKHLHLSATRLKNKEWILRATLLKGSPVGPISSDVTLTPDWIRPLSLAVLGQVVSNVYAEPAEIYVQTSESPKRLFRRINIRSRSTKVQKLQIASISPSIDKAADVSVDQLLGEHFILVNIVVPSSTQRAFKIKGTILIKVSFDEAAPIELVVPIVIEDR